jgi:hypothetical protein
MTVVKASAAALLALAVAGAPTAAGAASSRPAPRSTTCAQAQHRFFDATSATTAGGTTTVAGHKARFHCGGPDDGNYQVEKRNRTITLDAHATIKVFNNPQDPSQGYRTVKPAQLERWLKKNSAEPIYRIGGPSTDVIRMVEQFHP